MRYVRAAVRMFRLAHESLFLFGIYMLGRIVVAPAGKKTGRTWRRLMYRTWARRMTALFGVRPEISGVVPEGTFLLVSNHVSYLDITVLAQIADVAFIAKDDIRRWPLIGMLAASVGTIFVKRESRRDALRVATEMGRALDEGRGVAVFPEGTATNGTTLLPFKPTLLEVAAQRKIDVYSATLIYSTDDARFPAEKFVAWADDESFVGHVWRQLQLPRVRASVIFGPARRSEDRKELAAQLWNDVDATLQAHR
jgi:1-acyl-sn-glycerol-3-phosphate acyltransferase